MKVEYRTIVQPHAQDDVIHEYLLTADGPSFCCDDMQHAWRSSFIRFGYDEGVVERETHMDGGHCSLMGARPLIQACAVYFQQPSRHNNDALRLDYCPFCAKKIETVEVARHTVTWEMQTKEVTVKVLSELATDGFSYDSNGNKIVHKTPTIK